MASEINQNKQWRLTDKEDGTFWHFSDKAQLEEYLERKGQEYYRIEERNIITIITDWIE